MNLHLVIRIQCVEGLLTICYDPGSDKFLFFANTTDSGHRFSTMKILIEYVNKEFSINNPIDFDDVLRTIEKDHEDDDDKGDWWKHLK